MEELIARLRTLIPPDERGELDDESAAALLSAAGEALLNRLYPFDPSKTKVPARYENFQCRLALELWSKQGAEGQTYHSENGVGRTWESATLAPLLRLIQPFVGGMTLEESEPEQTPDLVEPTG